MNNCVLEEVQLEYSEVRMNQPASSPPHPLPPHHVARPAPPPTLVRVFEPIRALRARKRRLRVWAAMAARQEREPNLTRFVYVTRFGSHRCGGVLQLGSRGARGRWRPRIRLGAGCSQKEPREAEAETQGGGGELDPSARLSVPAASASQQQRASSRAHRGSRPAAAAGLTQKNVTKKYDFPIPLNEASKIMKTNKKEISVWNGVYKVICRMLEENEKYRLRLNSQRLSNKSIA
ncbi:PREDICTED: uncharacterized protein C5orf47 homolog [Chrysochloris asiatica]|uniref:Uncharacterized protein C5orf47 homolog n=1 Tax=Chrysochloris asiatica TaxID=185453 RepID=A0A9B0TGD2_CHRAS|nr:PREDICTED: uncharacterized protein C5orf47 homolog [Chrysochloris asiatica]